MEGYYVLQVLGNIALCDAEAALEKYLQTIVSEAKYSAVNPKVEQALEIIRGLK